MPNNIITKLFKSNKGILAIDESTQTSIRRFTALGLKSNEETRRQYRQTIIQTHNLENYISGIILTEETLLQKADNGKKFTQILQNKNIEIGLKVDEGLIEQSGFYETMGLENLNAKLDVAKANNVSFTKWRSVFDPNTNINTENIVANCQIFANYARQVLTHNLVPIIEPEILISKNHSLEQHLDLAKAVYTSLFDELTREKLDLSKIILKTGFVSPGLNLINNDEIQNYTEATINLFAQSLPNNLGGLVFLSGGLSPEQSNQFLQEFSNQYSLNIPYTFSFGRAIQDEAFGYWAYHQNDIKKVQQILLISASKSAEALKKTFG